MRDAEASRAVRVTKTLHRTAMALLCVALAGCLALMLAGCGGTGTSTGGAGDAGFTNGPTVLSATNLQGGTTVAPGQDVIITGRGFGYDRTSGGGGSSFVTFNPRSSGASPVKSGTYVTWSDTQIRCTVPTQDMVSDTYLVQVNLLHVDDPLTLSAPNWMTVVTNDAPVVTSVTPQTVNQGARIFIFGDGFGPEIDDAYESVQGSGYVMFGASPGGVVQPQALIWTRTMVVCNVPLAAVLGNQEVIVVTDSGQSAYTMATVVGPTDPTVSTVSPAVVDTGSTTLLTITGTNLGATQGTGKLTFQGGVGAPVTVTTVTSWSDQKIVCPVPASMTTSAGTIRVSVTTGTGATTNAYPITVDSVGPLLHGPRLGLLTQRSATISWDTRDAEIGEVRWGTTTSYGGSLKETVPTTNHRLTIEGLSTATTYHYTVVAGGQAMSDHTFTTAPPTGASTFTFASMADSRGRSDRVDLVSITAGFDNILREITKRNPSFALHGGDLFYGNKVTTVTIPLYDTFKAGTDPYCGNLSMLISPGNHEMQKLEDAEGRPVSSLALFNQEFAQPDQLAGYEGTCYSFDWGNSHFVSVDTCHYDAASPNGGMAYISNAVIDWMEIDLKAAQARKVRHIFVFGHANAFSKWTLYYLGSVDAVQRDKFWAALVKYKVDAYICGHEHLFNDKLGTNGVVQWLNGDSGSVVPGSNEFTIWKVNGDTVDAELLDENGNTMYKRTIQSSQPK